MTTQDKLDARYGRGRRSTTRWAIGAAVTVGAVAAGMLAWSTISSSLDAVDVDTTGFAVVNERTVVVNFQFTAPTGRSVACALEAQDEEHGVVGWKVVEYPASESHARAFEEVIPTTALGTTGFVNSCWVT
ncbi:DUF4307 domain-containing protein [Microbacterium sp. SLBN-146]|uniref:DUF4307 domain-containing protein n=1 Tax=Microbacterium sp. SLBN-146 TaxID=2768457 RepID=UPI00114F5EF0|nr:DUF4307 domain-containing protein [Microbacterium sp. SLBN-146]TQJ31679.1 uncharacterized protein DUF4307 [Microbacterium sp. SLBN-146]